MKRKIFLDDVIKPIHKMGKETTPSGRPKYTFWFGHQKTFEAYTLWKFNNHKTVYDAPECVITSFRLNDFVKVAKEVGLHISKEDRRQLEGE